MDIAISGHSVGELIATQYGIVLSLKIKAVFSCRNLDFGATVVRSFLFDK